jgi:tetratricopeptide (TPR) repeat protein
LSLFFFVDLFQPFIDKLHDTASVEEYGDLFFDVAVAHVEASNYIDALILFEKLLSSEAYHNPEVMMRAAFCYHSLQQFDQCIDMYNQSKPSALWSLTGSYWNSNAIYFYLFIFCFSELAVLQLNPGHVEAILALSSTYLEQGSPEQSIEILSNAPASAKSDLRITIQTALVHQAAPQTSQIIMGATPVVLKTLDHLREARRRRRRKEGSGTIEEEEEDDVERDGDGVVSEGEGESDKDGDATDRDAEVGGDVLVIGSKIHSVSRSTCSRRWS